jgi:glycosyltransferase involved in cell wall biosynthesis
MAIGGAETVVCQMCHVQRDQGHEPCIYAIAGLGALGEQMRNEGFAVHAGVGRHLTDSTRAFLRIFKESKPDIVHIHNPTPTIYAAMAARLAGVPSILSTRHSLVAQPRKTMEEIKYAVASRFCDWIVGICEATTENIRSIHSVPGKKIIRVYNGAAALTRTARDLWPPKQGFTLIYVGRLEPVKNHALLLHAFRAALSSAPNLRLWMVGDGSERNAMENLSGELGISKEVSFWGQQLDVAPFFSAADAFIMSSKSEGLPMSLLQAFSLGLPAIVTDVGGMAEVVHLAQAGLVVPDKDHMKMAEAILRLAGSDSERKLYSKNAEAAYREHFTLQAMADAYMGLYRSTKRFRRQAHCRPLR